MDDRRLPEMEGYSQKGQPLILKQAQAVLSAWPAISTEGHPPRNIPKSWPRARPSITHINQSLVVFPLQTGSLNNTGIDKSFYEALYDCVQMVPCEIFNVQPLFNANRNRIQEI